MRVNIVNADSVTRGDRDSAARFVHGCHILDPDLVLACECADFHARDLLGPEWDVVQFGWRRSPNSALVLAIKKDLGQFRDAAIVPGTTGGYGIRARPILTAQVKVDDDQEFGSRYFRVAAGHAPPRRNPWKRRLYNRRHFPNVDAAIHGGDLNINARAAKNRFPHKRVYSAGVLHAAIANGWDVHDVQRPDIDADHRVLSLELR